MDWVSSVIWWHCYPLRFVGAETRADELADGQVEHRLGRIAGWLDYLIDLGANGLMLAPVFASTSHGYDTLDYFRVDPRLGDLDDCRRAGRPLPGAGHPGVPGRRVQPRQPGPRDRPACAGGGSGLRGRAVG